MSKFTPCRLPISVLLCLSAVSWHCIRDIYFKLSCSGLRESTQPATSFSSLLTYVVIFFHSLTHLFTGSHTHTQWRTVVQLGWNHTCGLFPRLPGQWCSLLKAAGHTIVHFFFSVSCLLLFNVSICLSLAILVFWKENTYHIDTLSLKEERERERATVRGK